jgi:predicted HicB family RNase H-like nuclease
MTEREQTTIRLPAELKRILQQEADDKGISLNSYLLILIDRGRQWKQK